MENASKALIIAGAILLSILIIGIGMFIYNQAQEQINSSAGQMSQEEVRVFNAQFQSYAGNRISGSQVKQLLTKLATNATKFDQPNSKDERKPKLTVNGVDGGGNFNKKEDYTPSELNTLASKVPSTKIFKVTMNVSDATNIIDDITIEDSKTASSNNSGSGNNSGK